MRERKIEIFQFLEGFLEKFITDKNTLNAVWPPVGPGLSEETVGDNLISSQENRNIIKNISLYPLYYCKTYKRRVKI